MDSEPQIIDREQLLAHAAWIKALARSLVFDQARVDDMVQETWLVALDCRPRTIRNPRAWLAGILRNVVRREARGDRRRQRREELVARPDRDDGDDDLVARAEWHRVLVDAVLKLREPYRSTILAIDLEGESVASAARRQGISAATMRSRRARALQMLRERLDDDQGGRRRWSLALLPLALPKGAGSGATPLLRRLIESTTSIGKGALIVSAKTKCVLGLVTVIAILAGVWLPVASDVPSNTRSAAVVNPALPAASPPSLNVDLQPVASAAALLAAAPPKPRPAEVGSPITFSGRVVDGQGLAVPDARIHLLPDGWTLAAHGFEGLAKGRDDLDADLFSTPDDEPWSRFPTVVSDTEGRFNITAPLVLWGERTWLQSSYRFPELIVTHPDFATFFHACLERDGDRIAVGELMLQPAATLAGRVVGEAGEPLPDVLVSIDPANAATRKPAVKGQYGWGVEAGFRKQRTGADGSFDIGGLASGTWALRLTANDRLALKLEDIALSSPGTQDLGDVVLGRGGEVAGLVVDGSGAPIEGAEIFAIYHPSQHEPPQQPAELSEALALLREGGLPWAARISLSGNGARSSTTDAEGRFTLSGFKWHTVAVYVDAPGCDPTVIADVTTDGESRTITLQLQSRLVVSVLGVEGAPLANPSVQAFRPIDGIFEDHTETLPVSPGEVPHQVVVGSVGAAPVVVLASADGYGPAIFMLSGRDSGAQDERRTVTLPAATARISGRTLDEVGQPIEGATVTLTHLGAKVPTVAKLLPAPQAVSDAEGHYSIEAVPTGSWGLSAQHHAYLYAGHTSLLKLDGQSDLAIDLVLPRGGRLQGVVLSADGSPRLDLTTSITLRRLPDADWSQPSGWHSQTDRSGFFTSDTCRPGVYEIEAEHVGLYTAEVHAGEVTEVLLRPQDAHVIHGRVTAAGRPVAGAEVRATYDSPYDWELPTSRATTDDRGLYELTLSHHRPLTLTARTPSGADGQVVAMDPPSVPRTLVDLTIDTGRLQGLVTAEDTGEPVAGALVSVLLGIPGRRVPRITTDEHGRFSADGMPHRTATIGVRADGFAPAKLTDVPVGDSDEPVEITLATGASLLCRFVTEAGEASQKRQVLVYVFRPDSSSAGRLALATTKWSQSDAAQVSFGSLVPGRAQLLFLDPIEDLPRDYDELRPLAVGELSVDLPAGASVERDVVLRSSDP